jgi:hypothetical protein
MLMMVRRPIANQGARLTLEISRAFFSFRAAPSSWTFVGTKL